MKLLFIGDVYGEKGIQALKNFLPQLKQELKYQLLIINGENSADGLGMRLKEYKEFMSLGAHVITLGNHGFSKKEILEFIDEKNIVRPINYPKGTPGKGVIKIAFNTESLAVINVMGRVFMHDPLNNPFEALDDVLNNLEASFILVDVHAETTSEKLAIAHYLDGRVGAVIGTHTHVQTNDAMVLPKGTLYITDAGMTGVKYGILGADKDLVLKKFTSGMPTRLQPSNDATLQLNGVFIDTDLHTISSIQKFSHQ